ncbi:hypothetical protein D3C71_2172030 [compost metagenome]
MSILISYAPKNVIIHTNEKQSPYLTSAVLKVYREKAQVCSQCNFCEIIREKCENITEQPL